MKMFKSGKSRLVEIFLGLIHGVNVSKYAKIAFNAEQMREIREGLEAGVDISYYSEPRKNGSKGYYSSESMETIKDALIFGVDTRIIEMWKNEYTGYKKPFELSDITLCAKAGIDVGNILDKGYSGEQIDLICRFLHLNPEMEEVLFENINPEIKCYVIKFIAWGLKYKSDVSNYHKLGRELTFEQAKSLIWWHKKGFDITKYIDCYSFEQIEAIYYGKTQLVDVSKYEDKSFNPQQMYEIRTGLEMGIDVSSYADKKYSSAQMKVIRKGLIAGVDVSKYANPKMDPLFMREVLEALLVLKRAEAFEKQSIQKKVVE